MATQQQVITILAESVAEYDTIVAYLDTNFGINETNFDIYDLVEYFPAELKIKLTYTEIREVW